MFEVKFPDVLNPLRILIFSTHSLSLHQLDVNKVLQDFQINKEYVYMTIVSQDEYYIS